MKKILSAIVFFSLIFLFSVNAFATDADWTGGDPANADWSDADNWSAVPVPGTADTATFNAAAGAGGAVINLFGGLTVKSVTFDTLNAVAYTIGSGGAGAQTLIVDDAGTITVSGDVVTAQTIAANLVLLGDYALTNNAADSSVRRMNLRHY